MQPTQQNPTAPPAAEIISPLKPRARVLLWFGVAIAAISLIVGMAAIALWEFSGIDTWATGSQAAPANFFAGIIAYILLAVFILLIVNIGVYLAKVFDLSLYISVLIVVCSVVLLASALGTIAPLFTSSSSHQTVQ